MSAPAQTPRLYGLLAEFDSPTSLVEAIEKTRAEGYRRVEAYTPFPIEEVAHALGFNKSRLPMIVLIGGICGGCLGFGLQFYLNVIDYPYNVGGRPNFSWPMFIPVTFELTILGAALSTVLGMLALNRLPEPYHPLFNVDRFALASRDRFFLCVESKDPKFNRDTTRQFLQTLHAKEVSDVEP